MTHENILTWKFYIQKISQENFPTYSNVQVVTKTWNEIKQTIPFHSFRILYPEAILYLSPNPKNFDLDIPNPKLKIFC